jgi:membrane-bound serine protease (ClpP class)
MRRPTSIRAPRTGASGVLVVLVIAAMMSIAPAALAASPPAGKTTSPKISKSLTPGRVPGVGEPASSASMTPTSTSPGTPAASAPNNGGEPQAPVLGLEIRDAIGPATALYVEHGLEVARQRGSPFVILEIDTPGGLASSMRDIISAILAAPMPVVAYVAPPGARAASAGTYILYACHIAAMAPATNLGAATPVSIGGSEPAPPEETPTKSGKKAAPESSGPPMSAEERKVLNDSIAYIRGLAQLRGRNADWAEQAVRGAASLPATQALQQHVIDLIAPDLPSLLAQLNGREVRMGDRTVRLDTRGARVEWMRPDWRTRLLGVITNPEIAYGLLLIGIWGLLFEGYHPGGVLPGVVGVICLLVALFAFQLLPTNFAGLALLIIGAGMMAAEFFFPAYGSLGIGGLIAFIVGSLILFSGASGIQVALPLIGGLATVGGLVILGIVYLATRAHRTPVVTGTQAMLGALVEASEDFALRGRVRYGGELWNATSSAPLKAGQAARVVKVEGLTLWVEPLR